jgi:hypothetical protein
MESREPIIVVDAAVNRPNIVRSFEIRRQQMSDILDFAK